MVLVAFERGHVGAVRGDGRPHRASVSDGAWPQNIALLELFEIEYITMPLTLAYDLLFGR